MVIEHTTDLDVGQRPNEYHHLAKIDNIHFDPALYVQNRARMTSGELACWHVFAVFGSSFADNSWHSTLTPSFY